MPNQVQTYTSTGQKILRHPWSLANWIDNKPRPLSLQVAPTEYCSLRCRFCSVKNRTNKHVFQIDRLIEATRNFIWLGVKTVEITGGGDPMCYPKLNQYIEFLADQGMEIGIITNSLGINRCLSKDLLKYITWIRISSNVYDYKHLIEIPTGFEGTLGFSYCWTEGLSTKQTLLEIKKIAEDNGIKYVRLVPNCLASNQEQQRNNLFLSMLAEEIGAPVFFQTKSFEAPPKCYWGYFKPFLYTDEYVYPCSSTVLNPDADQMFNPSYRWCHYSEVEKVWTKNLVSSIVDTKRCSHCVFTEQNKLLEYIRESQEHENFV